MRLALDLDGCLADFCHGLDKELQHWSLGIEPLKEDEEPSDWNWFLKDAHPSQRDLIINAADVIMSKPSFWSSLEPHPEGRKAKMLLWELIEKCEIILMTARPRGLEFYESTRSWLDYFYPDLERCPLLLVNDKVKIFNELEITHVIDDHPLLPQRRKNEEFTAKLYQPARKYNRILNDHTGLEVCDGEGPYRWMEKGTMSKLVRKVLDE